MGSNVNIHVGFYLQVKPQPVKRSSSVYLCTENPDGHPGGIGRSPGAFCSICGSAIKKVEKSDIDHESHPIDLLPTEFHDMFMVSSDNHSAWIPNFEIRTASGAVINKSYSRESDGCADPIDTQLIERLRGLIRQDLNFSSVMDHLESTYGPDCVQLMYGVVVEWN
ncbi:hypothetical protein RYA05_02620 [Pseudomonas syringae pv. actinidiae]|nr:hypothetical protein [Pseudomonas syringae pv. actinidiae]